MTRELLPHALPSLGLRHLIMQAGTERSLVPLTCWVCWYQASCMHVCSTTPSILHACLRRCSVNAQLGKTVSCGNNQTLVVHAQQPLVKWVCTHKLWCSYPDCKCRDAAGHVGRFRQDTEVVLVHEGICGACLPSAPFFLPGVMVVAA